jgi:hypothetical protein
MTGEEKHLMNLVNQSTLWIWEEHERGSEIWEWMW